MSRWDGQFLQAHILGVELLCFWANRSGVGVPLETQPPYFDSDMTIPAPLQQKAQRWEEAWGLPGLLDSVTVEFSTSRHGSLTQRRAGS